MPTIAYTSPYIPPEWVIAHGVVPRRLFPSALSEHSQSRLEMGVCPYTRAFLDAHGDGDAHALVVTSTCDQMRRAHETAGEVADTPAHLFQVPVTWQSNNSRETYRDELLRLGDFLRKSVGGVALGDGNRLRAAMLALDDARSTLRALRGRLPAREFSRVLAEFPVFDAADDPSRPVLPEPASPPPTGNGADDRVPLALLGGPLLETDLSLFDLIEEAGGRVVLDALETGERTLPAPFDRARVEADPINELVDAYFGSIPGVFRRPNTALFDWLASEIAEREVRGVIVRRYLWCDLWHAEVERFRDRFGVPLLDLDSGGIAEESTSGRLRTRVEAFLDTLK